MKKQRIKIGSIVKLKYIGGQEYVVIERGKISSDPQIKPIITRNTFILVPNEHRFQTDRNKVELVTKKSPQK